MKVISRNQACAGLRLVRAWFKNCEVEKPRNYRVILGIKTVVSLHFYAIALSTVLLSLQKELVAISYFNSVPTLTVDPNPTPNPN